MRQDINPETMQSAHTWRPWHAGLTAAGYSQDGRTATPQRGECNPICDLLGSSPDSATCCLCELGQANLSRPQFPHLQSGLITVSVLKNRDITLPTKFCIVKVMVFLVVVNGYESWTRKGAECQRSDDFKLWCWRRLSRVLWTAQRSNQSILKEINPECLLEGLMLKLKPQSFGHLMQRVNSLEKTLTLGKTEGRRGRDNGG